ncbi:hypothetical protein CEXT_617971 [Caerostris extrusa]|uniref:Uncharacterized protein n=1 Tax=Caerostris extrusa TaxID=172846 RepID=A0AAV4QWZ9_CAEEX|nr:hypothetical protein CEXT_617971 [Caerostris extrusa]
MAKSGQLWQVRVVESSVKISNIKLTPAASGTTATFPVNGGLRTALVHTKTNTRTWARTMNIHATTASAAMAQDRATTDPASLTGDHLLQD